MKTIVRLLPIICMITSCQDNGKTIDRKALLERNSPQIYVADTLSSFTVGNGDFAFTVDATGLQSFPVEYSKGIPLGTQSSWGWHNFANNSDYKHEETLKLYNFRGKEEPYSIQYKEAGRNQDASNWFRVNPHRLHLGCVGLDIIKNDGTKALLSDIQNVNQKLKLHDGVINTSFTVDNNSVFTTVLSDSSKSMIAVRVESELFTKDRLAVKLNFPYPTGGHCDDACDWNKNDKHTTEIVNAGRGNALLRRVIDDTQYYVSLNWDGDAELKAVDNNYIQLIPGSDNIDFTCEFINDSLFTTSNYSDVKKGAIAYWNNFWDKGGIVDFSNCKDTRAPELERRVVLSQYLMAVNCAGSIPPQETGLTYNSWYGKFHLEMHWWHASHFPLWGHPELLKKSLSWYSKAYPKAKSIAERQGFDGVRWMKMTDPSATEAPSRVGSFLIWQQPHFIYLAELLYRCDNDKEVINKYYNLVQETARFMYSFADYDEVNDRYILKGAIPAQESLRASETINPPFELSYWHFALSIAQKWRERKGEEPNTDWNTMIAKLSSLKSQDDGLYLAAEDAVDTYNDIRYTSDHMAVLGALGILPKCDLVDSEKMKKTFDWVYDNWNWGKTWGWDYPMTAMNAVRVGEPDKAINALFLGKRTNTYLVNGHNYQDGRLRVYLPGNGGLLTAVALMCAGWDGCEVKNPGFPKDGNWDVKWEGLKPLP